MSPSVAQDAQVNLNKEPKVTSKVTEVSGGGAMSMPLELIRLPLQPRKEQIVLNTIRCLAADLCQQVRP